MSNVAEVTAQLRAACEQLTAPGAPFELETRIVNGVPMPVYRLAPRTLPAALAQGREHGDRTAITYQDERYTFSQFFTAADRLAHYLVHRAGIRKGDRVAIAMRNYPEWMMSFAAIVSIGAIAVPLNSWGRAEELGFALGDAQARVVICDLERHALIAPQLADLGCQAIVVRARDNDIGQATAWEATQQEPAECPPVDIDPDDLALIMYTSGTTGKPKGAASTHFAIGQSLHNFNLHAYSSAMINPDTVGKMMASGFEPSTLLAVPLFHVSGCYAVFLLNLISGRKTSIMYKWDPEEALHIIEQERITIFTGVPAMTIAMLESPRFAETDTSSLFSVGAGGTACPPHLKDLIYGKLPDAYPGTGYGMTETNAAGSSCTGIAWRLQPRSSGTVAPIIQIRSVSPEGEVLQPGVAGELQVRSPTNMREYWNRPDATAETILEGGWLRTGDIGYVDENGFVFIVDRIKDMVIRSGENIYPIEVEGVLTAHDNVIEAAVYGLPHPQLGEELAATVYGRNGVSSEELRAYLAEHLAGFKVPTQWVITDEALPKNATGKLLKRDVRQAHLANWQYS